MGYNRGGGKETDVTERLTHTHTQRFINNVQLHSRRVAF